MSDYRYCDTVTSASVLKASPASYVARPQFEARKDATRRQICVAANDLFVTRGFADPTMEEIAQASGIQRSTLYTHFRDKEAILTAIAADYIDDARREIARLPGPVPTATQAAEWIDGFAAFVVERPAPSELIFLVGHSLTPPAVIYEFHNAVLHALGERSDAFARALQPGEGFQRAWADATLTALGTALNYTARHGRDAASHDRLNVATMLFTRFVQDDR